MSFMVFNQKVTSLFLFNLVTLLSFIRLQSFSWIFSFVDVIHWQTTLSWDFFPYDVLDDYSDFLSSLPHLNLLRLQVFSTSWRFLPQSSSWFYFVPNPSLGFCFQRFLPSSSRHRFLRTLPYLSWFSNTYGIKIFDSRIDASGRYILSIGSVTLL
jgi:hypothetical protein